MTDRVKPLVWQRRHNRLDEWKAHSPVGMYEVGDVLGRWSAILRHVDDDSQTEDIVIGRFDDADKAKAAAQSDYEARILSALMPAQGEPVANPMGYFDQNVDRWGAAEWFDRLARALHDQDNAVLEKNDIGFETYQRIAASSAMRLVRDYEDQVRAALHPSPSSVGVTISDEMVADIATAIWRPDIPAEVRSVSHAALKKALTAALKENG